MKRALIILAVALAALWLLLRRYTMIEGQLPIPPQCAPGALILRALGR